MAIQAINSLGVASPISGIQNLHIARVTENTPSRFTGEKPLPYPGLSQITPQFNETSKQYDADNRTFASESAINGASLQMNLAGVTPEFEEYILGSSRKNLALLTSNVSGVETIVKYEVTKSNGGSKFIMWGACRFAPSASGGQTRGSNYQDVQLTAQVAAPNDGTLGFTGQLVIDTDSPEFKASGLTVDQARDLFFSNFYWDGVTSPIEIRKNGSKVTSATLAVNSVDGKYDIYYNGAVNTVLPVVTSSAPTDLEVTPPAIGFESKLTLTPTKAGNYTVTIEIGTDEYVFPVTVTA